MSKTLFFIQLLFLLIACNVDNYRQNIPDDIAEIRQRNELRVITMENSISYYTTDGNEMGFDYDLAQNFADYMDLPLKIVLAASNEEVKQLLLNGEADFAAYQMPFNLENRQLFNVTNLISISQMMLVQPKNAGKLIENVTQLIGKEVFVKQNSKYEKRLKQLNEDMGGGIIIKYAPDSLTLEQIMYEVSQQTIPLTIADDDIAELGRKYFRNLDVAVPVSLPSNKAWIVRKNAPMLTDSINEWFAKIEKTKMYKRMKSQYLSKNSYYNDFKLPIPKGGISPFDVYFKEAAKYVEFDWRMLAAVAWNESRFNTDIVSARGAMGLMQLMPRTATKFGLTETTFFTPRANIIGGAKLLNSLSKMFAFVENPNERIKFVLAAYNAGQGHIFDAVALAKKYDASTQIWADNVEKYLMLQSEHKYYNDEVCKLGYFNAAQTIRFVDDVLRTYDGYMSK